MKRFRVIGVDPVLWPDGSVRAEPGAVFQSLIGHEVAAVSAADQRWLATYRAQIRAVAGDAPPIAPPEAFRVHLVDLGAVEFEAAEPVSDAASGEPDNGEDCED